MRRHPVARIQRQARRRRDGWSAGCERFATIAAFHKKIFRADMICGKPTQTNTDDELPTK